MSRPILVPVLCSLLLAHAAGAACPPDPGGATVVELLTSEGEICLEVYDTGPGYTETVGEFLGYVTRGDYDGTFIHRSMPGFVIQGGGFFHDAVDYQRVCPPSASCTEIINEFDALSALRNCGPGKPEGCNLRATLAMARVSENDATSQWFINLSDTNEFLDQPTPPPGQPQEKGFVTFAEVTSGMDVVDAIAGLPVLHGPFVVRSALRSAFTNLPITSLLPATNCFDVDDVSIVITGNTCAQGQGLLNDPDIADNGFYFVSPPCFATPAAQCPGPELGLRTCAVAPIPGSGGIQFDGVGALASTPATCEQLEASDLAQPVVGDDVPPRLVSIQHAIVVPEPGPWLAQLAVITALAALRRRH